MAFQFPVICKMKIAWKQQLIERVHWKDAPLYCGARVNRIVTGGNPCPQTLAATRGTGEVAWH